MSMLAERKIKQKWSLNPRGKDWSEDSNKFGQKMLEKMGWSKGKGLGAKEDGIVEHLKISYKNDSKGMGFKDRNDQWTEHDANFNALLQVLSGVKNEEKEIKISSSLEEKSQSSKVRVHYKKFMRGKDLSRCSEKDLAQVFGKKSLKQKKNKIEDVAEVTEENGKESDFIRNSGSMVDYFKKKLPNFGKNNGYVVGSNGVLKKNAESEVEDHVGFGFIQKSDSEEETRVGLGFKIGGKRKCNGEMSNGTPKKMKKEEIEDGRGLRNPAFHPLYTHLEVQKHVLNTIEEEQNLEEESKQNEEKVRRTKKKNKKVFISTIEEVDENEDQNDVKKKNNLSVTIDEAHSTDIPNGNINDTFELKKKKKKDKFLTMDNAAFDDNVGCHHKSSNDTFEVKRKKTKKANGLGKLNFDNPVTNGFYENNEFEDKKKQNGLVNPNFDSNIQDNSCENSEFEVKRKKKKENVFDNPNFDSNIENNSCQNNEFEIERRKKKKENGCDNSNFDSSIEDSRCQSNRFEVERKKKKRENGLDNPVFDRNFENDDSQNNKFEVKRKMRKKVADDSLALDNPLFDSSNDCQNDYFDVNFEVKRKKKKKKDEDSFAIDNPVFDSFNDCQNSHVGGSFEVDRKKKEVSEESFVKPNDSQSEPEKVETEPSFDLILNVTSTPSVPKSASVKKTSIKRRKSVRFSDVNEERIIPNNEDIENRNELFDINSKIIENSLKNNDSGNLDLDENIDEFVKKIDGCQAEIENDLNEAKAVRFIGEIGNPVGENEKLPNGTRLKLKYANFGRSPSYLRKNTTSSKASYKHLIKGDIILGFKNTNLHEIVGYGVTNQNE